MHGLVTADHEDGDVFIIGKWDVSLKAKALAEEGLGALHRCFSLAGGDVLAKLLESSGPPLITPIAWLNWIFKLDVIKEMRKFLLDNDTANVNDDKEIPPPYEKKKSKKVKKKKSKKKKKKKGTR